MNGLQDDSYSYDPVGNITSINHGEAAGTDQNRECFRYVDRQRLTNAWTTTNGGTCTFNAGAALTFGHWYGPTSYASTAYGAGSSVAGTAAFNLVYAYDKIGNIIFQGSPTAQTGGGVMPGAYAYEASGQSSVRPHAVTSAFNWTTFAAYNANGSMTQRAVGAAGSKQCLRWDGENRVTNVSATITTACPTSWTDGDVYRYDSSGQRVSRVTTAGGVTKTTVYLDGLGEITATGSTVPKTKYYTSGGATVALRKDGTVTWLLGDQQGGVAVAVPNSYDGTAANTTGVQRQRYLPYGQRRGTGGTNDNITATEPGFLGQIEDGTGRLLRFATSTTD